MFAFKSLESGRVKLLPLEPEHALPLYEAAKAPQIWTHYPITIRNLEDMNRFIANALHGLAAKEQYPFAVWDNKLGKLVGSTRFLRISEPNNNLNIGSTWYSPEAWRTGVNTEAKYLMLKHAFETIGVNRVEIITTTDNMRSQQSIERLGAVREGLLRKKYHGLDYFVYSIIDSEWTGVKARLEGFLAGPTFG